MLEYVVSHFHRFYGLEYVDLTSSMYLLTRKAGHFAVYFFFGLLLFYAFQKYVRAPYLWTTIVGLLLALFDELNQFYQPGRSALIQDIFVDLAGIFVALLLSASLRALGHSSIQSKRTYWNQ